MGQGTKKFLNDYLSTHNIAFSSGEIHHLQYYFWSDNEQIRVVTNWSASNTSTLTRIERMVSFEWWSNRFNTCRLTPSVRRSHDIRPDVQYYIALFLYFIKSAAMAVVPPATLCMTSLVSCTFISTLFDLEPSSVDFRGFRHPSYTIMILISNRSMHLLNWSWLW